MKTTLPIIAALAMTACAQPEPICDREAQEWNKFDTAEDVCAVRPVARPWGVVPIVLDGDDPQRPTHPPANPHEPPVGHPEKPKGNNGWGNGDQSAPGNSGPNNNAENGDRTQRNHGPASRN